MLRAVGSPKIDEFVDVILNPRFTQHRIGHQGSSHASDRKAVRPGSPKNVVGACRPPPAAIYWTMIVGFPGMCLRKIVVTALVRKSAEPPGGPPKTTEIVLS